MNTRAPALAAAAAVVAALLSGAPAQAAPSLTAAVTQTSVWNGGYGADVTIANSGDTAGTSWTIEFDLPSGTTITSSWSSVRTSTGQHHKFTNAGFNGAVKPGATVKFGFNASGGGLPANCTINGAPCGATPPADTQAPSTPTGLRSTGVTSSSVSLSWTASTDDVGVTGYEVLRGGAVSATTTGTSATISGLSPATAHSFSVRAKDAAGNTSSASAAVSVTTSPDTGGGSTVDVATAAQLQAALAAATPGQTIRLAAGTYRGSFVVNSRAGTASQPITLTGPRGAVLINDGPSGEAPSCPAPTAGWDSGYGLWVFGSPHWNLTGFTVQESKKGIVLDNSHHTTIDGVSVHHVDEEAVHFRRSSADGVIRNSTITDTGLVQPGYGEGVYLGSANSNWACHGNTGGVDRSDRVQVLGNRIGPNVAAEAIDVKEGTYDGVIRGNTFDGQGITGQNSADSWVDVKGIGYLIEDNTGTFRSPGTFANGYETHNTSTTPALPNGCGNTWRGNRSDLGGVGQYAINITSVSKCSALPNVVYASNTVTGAVKGLTNAPVTP
ncbi:cellulose binding domain-containing protein [Lentzea sp. HUAS12]|uniref:cellulose binding domain-containing protein n=1 Tax=Lentzea sp. HUAS12 TaxID=2951806 RepID=UPI0020A083EC|nr:cellulose binding domain-containing protein [Lentzea sp. HUAS12]USX54566.1 cellulose binding domain-containing protein [Lentzea sp. HUAS12]